MRMNRTTVKATAASRIVGAAALIAGAMLAAGCGGTTASPGGGAAPTVSVPLATSEGGTGLPSWAVVEMGGSSATYNNFWELFVRPAGSAQWKLATPLGVASNGGLAIASTGPGLVAGFQPSQDLTFSPLATAPSSAAAWSQANAPVSPGLASVPDALAAGPAGQVLALTHTGEVLLGAHEGTAWTRLATLRSIASSAAGRSCGLTALTAVAWTPAGAPMVAGDCSRPGAAGVFTLSSGVWRAAGPTLSGATGRTGSDVIGLATTGSNTTAVLAVGSGATARVFAAWSADGGARWTLSPGLRTAALTAGATPSVSFLSDGSTGLVLTAAAGRPAASRAYTIGWRAGQWAALPALPARSGPGQLATLAATAGGDPQALIVDRGTLTVWQLGSGQWALQQTVRVSLPYGSSD